MGNTAKGFRYPAATDRVADGALAIEHLAEDVDGYLSDVVHRPVLNTVWNPAVSTAGRGAWGTNLDNPADGWFFTDVNGICRAVARVICSVVPSGSAAGTLLLTLPVAPIGTGAGVWHTGVRLGRFMYLTNGGAAHFQGDCIKGAGATDCNFLLDGSTAGFWSQAPGIFDRLYVDLTYRT